MRGSRTADLQTLTKTPAGGNARANRGVTEGVHNAQPTRTLGRRTRSSRPLPPGGTPRGLAKLPAAALPSRHQKKTRTQAKSPVGAARSAGADHLGTRARALVRGDTRAGGRPGGEALPGDFSNVGAHLSVSRGAFFCAFLGTAHRCEPAHTQRGRILIALLARHAQHTHTHNTHARNAHHRATTRLAHHSLRKKRARPRSPEPQNR